MKRHNWLKAVLLISAFVVLGNINSLAQDSNVNTAAGDVPALAADELRPFDFSDKYYASNGVEPSMLFNRSSGGDGFSVFDFTSDTQRNNVRILATYPAYGRGGETLFWNFYGELNRDGFTEDEAGLAAYEIANSFPIYIFPGESRNGGDRQAPVINTAEGYFEKNALGLGVAMLVRYNDTALTKEDALYLQALADQNGLSADGTPVIRTVKQINQLLRRNLVTVTPRDGRGQIPFIVGKVIQNPGYGAITPDAFLLYTKDANEKPLASEISFIKTFDCLKNNGSACL